MSLNSFSKASRLLSKADFLNLKKGSHSLKAPYVMAFYKVNKAHSRLGISASKKVGNAVKRNLAKRIIKEFFRLSDYRKLGVDILIVVNPRLFKGNSEQAAENLRRSLDKVFKSIQING